MSGTAGRERTASGFRYRGGSGLPDGILAADLRSGEAGKARIKLKGKGENLAIPVLGLEPPVTVQLRGAGGCWGAIFSEPSRNQASRFAASSD